LGKPDAYFKAIFESRLPPFYLPSDARQFFVWMWEVLFPDESLAGVDYEDFQVVDDVNEPNRLADQARKASRPPIKTVNPWFLHALIDPLAGLADIDEVTPQFAAIDPNSEPHMKRIISEMLLPHFQGLSAEIKDRSKTALGYYLMKPGADFKRVFESCLPPFDPPSDTRQFFVWIWEAFFPDESFTAVDYKGFRVVADIDEPNRLAARAYKASQASQ
jgi:hypothetical protein